MQMARDAALALELQQDENQAAQLEAAPAAEPLEEGGFDLAALQDVQVPLVGRQLPLATLLEDYEGSPRVRGNLMPLLQRFPYFRRIKGISYFGVTRGTQHKGGLIAAASNATIEKSRPS